jgi:hypothetical protein
VVSTIASIIRAPAQAIQPWTKRELQTPDVFRQVTTRHCGTTTVQAFQT